MISALEKLLGTPRDGALLRYSLGLEYQKAGNPEKALEHLREAVARDRPAEALAAYRDGIAAAQRKGDRQAEKEMTVFARRLEKKLGGAP